MNSDKSHYFTPKQKSPKKIRKLFGSVRSHTLSLQTSNGVFSPNEIDKGTRILIENLILPESKKNINILEIGAGYGPISIWLSKEYHLRFQVSSDDITLPKIYSSEVNQRAIWLFNRNIISNNTKNITILKGDFRDQIPELKNKALKFKAIYTNPPLKVGHSVLLELFGGAMELLSPNGFIQYVHKKKLGSKAFLSKLKKLKPDWFYKTIKKRAGYHVILVSPIKFKQKINNNKYSGYF